MSDPVSTKYHFVHLLSTNDLSQSWIAESTASGYPCFVKTVNPESTIPTDEKRNVLLNSYSCQRGIRNPRVLTARAKCVENGVLFIEYPKFDEDRWQVLTGSLLLERLDLLLPELFLTIDYLHFLQFVHCDLKLSNFIVGPSDSKGVPRIRLIDLDFMCEAGSYPKARIVGSPDHIAPEILNNETILIQSDNFSIGMMLKKVIEESLDRTAHDVEADVSRLRELADELTSADPLHRPRVLIDTLLKYKFVDQKRHAELERKLAGIILLNRYRETGVRQIENAGIKKSLLDACKILGLRTELVDSLQDILRNSKRQAFALFRRIALESAIKRLGEYWYLAPPGNLLIEVYNAASEISAGHALIPAQCTLTSQEIVSEAARTANDLSDRDIPEPALLIYQAIREAHIEKQLELSTELLERVLKESADLALQMGLRRECVSLMDEAVRLQQSRNAVDLDLVYRLIPRSFGIRPNQYGADLAELGMAEARKAHSLEMELVFESLGALVLCLEGKFAEVEESMRTILERSSELDSPLLDSTNHYVLGYAAFTQGRTADAEMQFRKSYEVARDVRLESEALRGAAGLVSCLRTMYRPGDTIKTARAVLTMDAIKGSERWREREMWRHLGFCYLRLGEYRKAEYWLSRVWSNYASEMDHREFATYYYSLLVLEKTRSSLEQAKSAAMIALDLVRNDMVALTEGHIYMALAEIACFEGNTQQVSEYAESARHIFERIDNQRCQQELELVVSTNRKFNTTEPPPDLLPLMQSLIEYDAVWDAGYCLFYMLMDENETRFDDLKQTTATLEPLIETAEIPIFAVLKELKPLMNGEVNSEQLLLMLKSCYRILSGAGRTFAAMIVCRRIALEYGKSGRGKLRTKFLIQSLRHATQLKNKPMMAGLQSEIDTVENPEENIGRIVASLLGISEILKHIDDYGRSLEQIVRFAVDQTGAERGVILEKASQSDELRVKAFVNCDDESLRDIADISMRVPSQVAHQHEPLILDNAVTDKRTKDYRSIVAHNILSVICLPIMHGDKLLGVLYLDHHTIPALFEQDDVTYIRSIANFIGLMLSAIESYRDMSVINRQLVEDINKQIGAHRFITQDRAVQKMFDRLPEIARFSLPVLILGESGTGKEIVAEYLHRLSDRKDRPLVKLNCSALPESMLESELFGVASNAATGVAARDGKFSAADGGTLFLDEIGDMPLAAQAKILRAVEYQEFERVGSNKVLKTDIRFIYATNKDLLKMIDEGTFRSDLYHRISGYVFEIPPLRERIDDIRLLLEHFVKLFSTGHRPPVFEHDVRMAFLSYDWPGNVRELRNVVERFCVVQAGEKVKLTDLPSPMQRAFNDPQQKKKLKEQIEKETIRATLIKNKGNVKRTAEALGMPYATLQYKIQKYHLKD
jgi:Nif-specific regulatory protein